MILEGWISVYVAMPPLGVPVLFLCWDRENNEWYLHAVRRNTATIDEIKNPFNEVRYWLEAPPFPRNPNKDYIGGE